MRVLVGVCGGIAAYKAIELVRALQGDDHTVRVMMTASAARFVAPLTFATLTGHRVYSALWEDEENATEIEHIVQAQWAERIVLAPATANTIAKLAHGLADDFVTTTCLAATVPILIAPAMNSNMWQNAATVANLATLQERGITIVPPDSGGLACGMVGPGRLADTGTILQALQRTFVARHDLAGEVVLVTAGGTREPIDAVRYIGNRSSGRMGYAIAAAAAARGARVVLVSAPVSLPVPPDCELVSVQTADEMREAVLAHLPQTTVLIKAAAVSDFRVTQVAMGKLDRASTSLLQLEPTPDIVQEAAARRRPGTIVIAFAAEHGADLERARRKLQTKGADAIFVNDISQHNIGFDAEQNAGVLLTHKGDTNFAMQSKANIAEGLLNAVAAMRASRRAQDEA